jgi:L-histidine N-alpha-methyltransferase
MDFQSRLVKKSEISHRLHLALNGGKNSIIDATEDMNPALDFAHSASRTLSEKPKWLECRFLYDANGSALFERICEQPEYYPTRKEEAILRECAVEISKTTGTVTLVEFGSGNSAKTRQIFSAYSRINGPVRYVPIDVSRSALQHACADIAQWNPDIKVAAIKGTYECAFPFLKELSPVLVIFLGSTIGNFNEVQDRLFWLNVSRCLSERDFFLLGVDLVKDTNILEAAYNDKAGVTAAFTLNLFDRMNKELKAGIDLEHLRHVARFSHVRNQIEIFAHFNREQRLRIKPTKASFAISAGESVSVEISRKFQLDELVPRLASYGFGTRRIFTDSENWFALLLLEKVQWGSTF